MRTLVIGDIHGGHKALLECLERSAFNYESDRLIVLGDVCDGWPEVDKSIDELIKIRRCDYVIGNHDLMALAWAVEDIKDEDWLKQGGENTIASYHGQKMPKRHIELFERAHLWLEDSGVLFVHGGFDWRRPITDQSPEDIVWDRRLVYAAAEKYKTDPGYKFPGYREIFTGHTPTRNFKSDLPLHFCNVHLLDTGAGWGGKLTIMDIVTKEYWQSDPTTTLYPHIPPRSK